MSPPALGSFFFVKEGGLGLMVKSLFKKRLGKECLGFFVR
jgi:hypothetical protein